MMRMGFVFVLIAVGLLPAGTAFSEEAVSLITGTADGSTIVGEATFSEADEGLRIVVEIANAPAGLHGFHIHETGSCDDQGKAAGGHFNPDGVDHGDLMAAGVTGAHAGDLGNLEVGPNGIGSLEGVYPALRISEGSYAIDGRSVILHADPDDLGQPTGNAGGRIACGFISVDRDS